MNYLTKLSLSAALATGLAMPAAAETELTMYYPIGGNVMLLDDTLYGLWSDDSQPTYKFTSSAYNGPTCGGCSCDLLLDPVPVTSCTGGV